MYNTINCACIKQILDQMKLKDLLIEIDYMYNQLLVLEYGNKRNMFMRLYRFAKSKEAILREELNNRRYSRNA